MIKKEFNEVSKQALYLLLAVGVLPVLICLAAALSKSPQAYIEVLLPTLQAGLLFWALFSGISLFTADRKGQGIEYIFSLPLPRWRLLAYKIAPRLLALAGFYGLYLVIFHTIGMNYIFMSHTSFSYLYFVLFLLSLSFSVPQENFVIAVLLSLFTFGLYMGVVYLNFLITLNWRGGEVGRLQFRDLFVFQNTNFMEMNSFWIFLAVFTLSLPFVIAFVWTFKKVDLRPVRNFSKRYLKIFLPFFIVCLGFSLLFAYLSWDRNYRSYYLTREHKLIEFDGYRTRIYDGEGVTGIDDLHPYDVRLEMGNYWYYNRWTKAGGHILRRIDRNHFRSETVYQPETPKRFSYPLHKWGKTVLLFEFVRGERRRTLVSVNVDSRAVKKIEIPGEITRDDLVLSLLGIGEEEGRTFWLISSGKKRGYKVYRIWEDGTWQQLTTTPESPLFVNRLLIHYDRDVLQISRLTGEGLETVKSLPLGKEIDFYSSFWCRALNPRQMKEIYGTRFEHPDRRFGNYLKHIYRLDLNNLELTEVGTKVGIMRYFEPGYFYWLTYDRQRGGGFRIQKIYRLQNGKITLLKEFLDMDSDQRDRITGNGLVIQQDGRTRVFALPEMKELIFKGLN